MLMYIEQSPIYIQQIPPAPPHPQPRKCGIEDVASAIVIFKKGWSTNAWRWRKGDQLGEAVSWRATAPINYSQQLHKSHKSHKFVLKQ